MEVGTTETNTEFRKARQDEPPRKKMKTKRRNQRQGKKSYAAEKS